MERINWVAECAAFMVMLSVSLVIGLYYGCVERKQNTVSEYLLGGKHMTVFPITMSLIASHITAMSLIGVPLEIYSYGTQYLAVGFVIVLIAIVTVYVYLPVFYELQVTSVYEYLELRFDSKIRWLSSLIYAISLVLFIPLVIYISALSFNQFTGVNVNIVIPVVCVTCIFYTTIGGLKAVVWTDAIQSAFMATAVVVIVGLGLWESGGFGNLIRANLDGDRIEFFRMDPNPFLRNTFWTIFVGMTLQWITHLSIQPGVVQRYVALPTLKMAKSSLIYFVFGIGVVQTLTGVIGMLIYAKYKDCDPVSANYIDSDRNLVPYYVMDIAGKFPGVTGLFVSGIVGSALSSMSAHLNTVSGTIYEDFIVSVVGVKCSDSTASIIMKCTVVIVGIICALIVILVEKLKGIMQLSISLYGITNGAILSVFTLGICFPRANTRGAMCGLFASMGIMTWIVFGAQLAIYNNELVFVEKDVSIAGCPANITIRHNADISGLYRMNEDVYVSPNVWKIYTVSYLHYTTIGTLVGIAAGLVVSWLCPADQSVDPKLLMPCIRDWTYAGSTRADKSAKVVDLDVSLNILQRKSSSLPARLV